jgi:hypothetical protein
MVDEQQPPEDDETSNEPPGPRRSTYTPPPQSADYDPSATDDDALAGALANEFRRWSPPPRESAPAPVPPSPPDSLPFEDSISVSTTPAKPKPVIYDLNDSEVSS